jgi:hypothetical protein
MVGAIEGRFLRRDVSKLPTTTETCGVEDGVERWLQVVRRVCNGGSATLFVAAVFVAIFVLDADFHPTAGPIFVVVTPVVSISVRAVPASIVPIAPVTVSSAIFVAITIIITVAVPSPVGTHFAIFATHTVAVAATHPPVATNLTVIGPRLVAIGPLIPLLLGFLVRLCWNCLRR